jgi:uncharacterized membrane protein YqiK
MESSAVDPVVRYGWILVLILIVILYRAILRAFFGTVIISKDEIGIVNKKWVLVGKYRTLPDGAIVALNGEAGLQADTLAPGIHFGLWAWQYQVSKVPFTTIDKTHIGIVEARDGHPLSGGRVLARTVECIPRCARLLDAWRRTRAADLHHSAGNLSHQHRTVPGCGGGST